MFRSNRREPLVFAFVAIAVLLFGFFEVRTRAQVATPPPEFAVGKNVNAIGRASLVFDPLEPSRLLSNPAFDYGDIDRKQQDEPSVAISPSNVNVRCIGMNDYAGVDRDEVGEPWIGLSCTDDGGVTWRKVMHPRFSGDDRYPPLPYRSSADPILKAVPGALLYFFINFDRGGSDDGLLAMSVWAERPTEGGFPYCYSHTSIIDVGTAGPNGAGKFFDKESAAVQLTPGTQPLTVSDCAGGTRQIEMPNADIWVAYAKFTGSDPTSDSTEILLRSSTNYGGSWSNLKKVSNSVTINQSAVLALNDKNIVVVWRRFGDNNELPGIVYAYSKNGGKQFTGPLTLWEAGCFFDQGTTSRSFRTTAHPAITFDGTDYIVAWSARATLDGGVAVPAPAGSVPCTLTQNSMGYFEAGAGRIVVSRSSTGEGGWTPPVVVDAGRIGSNAANQLELQGHQFMPFLVSAGERTTLGFSDTRNDLFGAWRSGEAFIDDYIVDDGMTRRVKRRTGDVYATQAANGSHATFSPQAKRVTRFTYGHNPEQNRYTQLNFNALNSRHVSQGRLPFNGDYNAAAGVDWVKRNGVFVSSVGQSGVPEIVQFAWTDNRDMRGNTWLDLADDQPVGWTGLLSISESDPSYPQRPVCKADDPTTYLTGTRDQQIYTATLFPDLYLSSASASNKALGALDERAFSITLHNTTSVGRDGAYSDRFYRLTIHPPTSGTASFERVDPGGNPLTVLQTIQIPPRSSIARTVYVHSTDPMNLPPIEIEAEETDANGVLIQPQDGGAAASLFLNEVPVPLVDPDVICTDLTNPDCVNSVSVEEVHDLEIAYRSAPAIEDPAIEDPAIEDPAIEDPAIEDPAIEDPAIEDPAIEDPAIEDPAIEDASFQVPAIEDPAIEDPAIEDASISAASLLDEGTYDPVHEGQSFKQITWKMTMDGNTTTSVTAKVFASAPADVLEKLSQNSQILVSRRYRTLSHNTRAALDKGRNPCLPVLVNASQVVANVVNPTLDARGETSDVDIVDPPRDQPSFAMPPGSEVFVTLRIYEDPSLGTINPAIFGVAVKAQPGDEITEEAVDSVMDLTAPILVLPPELLVLAEAEGPEGAVVNYTTPTANDETDGALPVTCSNDSGDLFPIGDTPVTCSATDSAGNTGSGSFTVSVEDNTAPSFVDFPGTLVVEAQSADGAVVSFTATASDLVDPDVVVSCLPSSGSTFDFGTTVVLCTATDFSDNSTTASFDVVVADTIAPSVSVPADITVEATSSEGALVTYAASATDGASGALTPTCSPSSGSLFDLGSTTVTCSATDGSGNEGSSSFIVMVRDTTAPLVSTPGDLSVEATGPLGAEVSFVATASDLVTTSLAVICLPGSGATFPLATTEVICSATDLAGNLGTSSFHVTVLDTTPPELSLPADVSVTGDGETGAFVDYTATATDLVDLETDIFCEPVSGSLFPMGTTTVDCWSIDGHSNRSDGSFEVHVALGFIGLLSPYEPPPVTNKIGSSIPILWQYAGSSGLAIPSPFAHPTVMITCPYDCGGPNDAILEFVEDSGSSGLRYDAALLQWQLNWQTKRLKPGIYQIEIRSGATGQTNGPFAVALVK